MKIHEYQGKEILRQFHGEKSLENTNACNGFVAGVNRKNVGVTALPATALKAACLLKNRSKSALLPIFLVWAIDSAKSI